MITNFFHGERVTPVRKLLMLKALAGGGPVVEDTATGNPLTFLTNLARPLKSLVVNFLPVQDGTGDPAPDNVRSISGRTGVTVWHTGKNLLNLNRELGEPSDTTAGRVNRTFDTTKYIKGLARSNYYYPHYVHAYTVSSNGITLERYNENNDSYGIAFPVDVVGNKKYTISATLVNCFVGVAYYMKDGTFISHLNLQANLPYTITTPNETKWLVISFTTHEGNAEATNIQLEVGETASEYEAYSGNEYAVTFPATGKNLLTSTQYVGQFFNIGAGVDLKKTSTHASFTENGNEITVTTDVTWYGCIFATWLLSPGTYNVHTETSDESCRMSIYVTDADLITKERKAVTSNNVSVTLTESSRIVVTINNQTTGSVVATNVQVESGDSYTSWEPFINTIYGGTLDLVTGVLTATYGYIGKSWSDFGNKSDLGDNVRGSVNISANPSMQGGTNALCNIAKRKWDYSEDSTHFYTDGNYCFVFLPKGTDESTEVQIAYPLAIPVSYQMTPQQITALANQTNTIWSDANGDCEVTYLKKG